jgi:type I restriction enzyme M protein
MTSTKTKKLKHKSLNTRQSVDQAVKSICDIMRRGNVTSAVQYIPELTWILFLRVLDETEQEEQIEAEALGLTFKPSLEAPYRWRDWGDPGDKNAEPSQVMGAKRQELENGSSGDVFAFVNGQLIPYLKGLEHKPDATVRQKVISEIISGVERVRIDTERNFLDVLDRVHKLSHAAIDKTHVFSLSQVYEGLLLKMGEKNNDGGQFFTPREIIRAMVRAINPQIGETVYDPGSGTGGFLAQSYEHIKAAIDQTSASADQYSTLKEQTFYGREKENLIYPIALANLVLHGIDHPHLWHGNTLTGQESYGGLFEGAPAQFDVILTNPPFGGKEGKDAQTRFDYKTGSTQVLYLQHIINSLKHEGRCGVVVDEGLLFRTNEDAFVKTKGKLLDECNLWCVVSLPGGVFTQAGAGVKTNLLFFTKGEPTRKIWYYDLSDLKVTKKKPFTLAEFAAFFDLMPQRGDSEMSWTVDFTARKAKAAEEAKPFHEQARAKQQEAARWKEHLIELKKVPRQQKEINAIDAAEIQIKTLIKEVNTFKAKATEIESAVYDLKAVNPNKKQVIDERTPNELLDIIDAKGKEISEALAFLRRG